MKKFFVGIDFSKLKFDAAIYIVDSKQIVSEAEFKNESSGYSDFLEWVNENACCPKSSLLFCGEHTGYYSANLSTFLFESGYDMWLAPGLQIKKSQGIKRAKTDRIDACKIAEYAYRFRDKALLFHPISKALDEIRDLLSYRERLVGKRKVLSTSAKEVKRVKDSASCDFIYLDSLEYIKSLSKSIRNCENRIEALMKGDHLLNTNYKLMNSVVGIGLVNSALILVATSNFSLFTNPKSSVAIVALFPLNTARAVA